MTSGVEGLELEDLGVCSHGNGGLEAGLSAACDQGQAGGARPGEHLPGDDPGGAVPACIHNGLAVDVPHGAGGWISRQSHPVGDLNRPVAQVRPWEYGIEQQLARF